MKNSKSNKKTYEITPELNEGQRKKLNEYSDVLAKLLFSRGIKTNKTATEFIDISYEKNQHDPFLMTDLKKAAKRILEAFKKNQKICIFSDYDADGVPGAVALNDFFKKIGYDNFFVYIPHRNLEGFGLNDEAVNEISEKKTDLIITIDCGVADLDQIHLANKLGMQVIVTDHHEIPNGLPEAFAIVDPKREDCKYPFDSLCGAGVVFKLIQGLIKEGEFNEKEFETDRGEKLKKIPQGWEKWLLDMVGIATLSDMVPLIDENRIFAKYGLTVLQKTRRHGLQRLFQKNYINPKFLNEKDVVFTVTPRINAASRMGHADTAFQMLSAENEKEAGIKIDELEKVNDQRKGVVAGMVKEIKKHVEDDLVKDGELTVPVIVKGSPKWSPSLLGLAASSIVDAYNCPVFIWGRGEGKELKGSCRSDGSASVVSIMSNLPEGILPTFGGHFMAGGFVLNFDAIDSVEAEMVKAYEKSFDQETNLLHKKVDLNLKIEEVDWKFFDEIKKLAPFGVGNEEPILIFDNVKIEEVAKFGKQNNHAKLVFKKQNGEKIEAIKFFIENDAKIKSLKPDDKITFTAVLEKSTFGGKVELRLRLLEIY